MDLTDLHNSYCEIWVIDTFSDKTSKEGFPGQLSTFEAQYLGCQVDHNYSYELCLLVQNTYMYVHLVQPHAVHKTTHLKDAAWKSPVQEANCSFRRLAGTKRNNDPFRNRVFFKHCKNTWWVMSATRLETFHHIFLDQFHRSFPSFRAWNFIWYHFVSV